MARQKFVHFVPRDKPPKRPRRHTKRVNKSQIQAIQQRLDSQTPSSEDVARGGSSGQTGGGGTSSPQGGMQAERTRSRDLGNMRGGVGR